MVVKQSATLDTSFWINAHRAGLAPFVVQRFDLYVSREVAGELSRAYEAGRDFWNLMSEGKIAQADPAPELIRLFGRGERSAMNLALEHLDWVLLMDDRRPYEEASKRGLKAVCSPVLVVQLFRESVLSLVEAHRFLAELEYFDTVSPSLISLARVQMQGIRRQREN